MCVVQMSRLVLAVLAVASVSCGPDASDEPPKRPVCGAGNTGAECQESLGGMGGASLSSSSGDGSSNSSDGVSPSSGGSSSSGTGGDEGSGSSTGPATVCGDGVVEGEEECDDGNEIDDDRCAVNCTKNRWVFATEALHNIPHPSGIKSADSYCAQYALQSGRADDSWTTFIAWLSDADNDVRDRLYRGKGRYVRTDNVVVVHSAEQFFSGAIEAPINVDEKGNQDIGGWVFTGTKPDGTRAPGMHCQNWTFNSPFYNSAYGANVSATGGGYWTMNMTINPLPCGGLEWRLYCIEGK